MTDPPASRPPEVAARAASAGASGGVPAAIALSPILSARYRLADLERIRTAAPGARLVTLSREGLADGPVDDAEVLLLGSLGRDALDRLLARAPRLAWIHSSSAGVEHVLASAARDRGIVITNARGVFSEPIAEYVVMMILAVSRRLPQLLELQRERTWQPLEGTEMGDLTVGVVGLGSIGRSVAARAASFGSRVVAIRRHAAGGATTAPGATTAGGAGASGGAGGFGASTVGRPGAFGDAGAAADAPPGVEIIGGPEALPGLLGQSDFVVLAAPLTPETQNLIDARALAGVKPGAWLINVARGALVDDRALLRALRDGPLGGAVLDTFREEPLTPSSPFYDLPNVIVTPQTAWSSGRVLGRSVGLFCENLVRYVAGRPLENVVDPGAGY